MGFVPGPQAWMLWRHLRFGLIAFFKKYQRILISVQGTGEGCAFDLQISKRWMGSETQNQEVRGGMCSRRGASFSDGYISYNARYTKYRGAKKPFSASFGSFSGLNRCSWPEPAL